MDIPVVIPIADFIAMVLSLALVAVGIDVLFVYGRVYPRLD